MSTLVIVASTLEGKLHTSVPVTAKPLKRGIIASYSPHIRSIRVAESTVDTFAFRRSKDDAHTREAEMATDIFEIRDKVDIIVFDPYSINYRCCFGDRITPEDMLYHMEEFGVFYVTSKILGVCLFVSQNLDKYFWASIHREIKDHEAIRTLYKERMFPTFEKVQKDTQFSHLAEFGVVNFKQSPNIDHYMSIFLSLCSIVDYDVVMYILEFVFYHKKIHMVKQPNFFGPTSDEKFEEGYELYTKIPESENKY